MKRISTVVDLNNTNSDTMPLTGTFNSLDDDILLPVGAVTKRSRSNRKVAPRRCFSFIPASYKSIMKRRTLDESLHSPYGSDDSAVQRQKASLQFSKIDIREYTRTVGDNPSCTNGPPVGISWDYISIGDVDLDEYEKTRPVRRDRSEMVLPRYMREDILKYECHLSRREITESVRQNVKIKNQRRTTINNLGRAEKLEEIMESLKRKLRRFMTCQKPVHKQIRDLEEEIESAIRTRFRLMYLEQNMSQGGEESAPVKEATETSSE
eukprot:jgi/Psemu1/326264/estExt_fgenesh1_pg.C_3550005